MPVVVGVVADAVVVDFGGGLDGLLVGVAAAEAGHEGGF